MRNYAVLHIVAENAKVFKNATGMIMTEYTFNVLESYNLSDDDLDNQKLKLTMPGGTLDGVTSMIDGAPQFSNGEKSFLLLKKIDSKIYLSNFTLGKYKIQDFDGKPYYVSEVYPTDPTIGKIQKESMVKLMKNQWKLTLLMPRGVPTRSIASGEPRPIIKSVHELERGLAQDDNDSNEGVPGFFWGAIFLFTFFFAFIFFKLGKGEVHYKSE